MAACPTATSRSASSRWSRDAAGTARRPAGCSARGNGSARSERSPRLRRAARPLSRSFVEILARHGALTTAIQSPRAEDEDALRDIGIDRGGVEAVQLLLHVDRAERDGAQAMRQVRRYAHRLVIGDDRGDAAGRVADRSRTEER